ncbi:MAG: hypothetical protein A3B37_03165 [Candidatus Sungbacteria bacterium RIFCSPLOWO2_01_FULL_59_16]|uniref:Uncharacterized protein n=1 Tax=Candidatus Sungbacteria bacterium RIFCSPLOWO2_01_FULL_59_16 TaxID=1802280 RepID=A0A1G2LBR7_9BACT|nr:MAG: hypothetical protein A3B37_03165 [Candidatus Sungbacteria bacterium RIFCSPLOWO2_01_FULL_59_16]
MTASDGYKSSDTNDSGDKRFKISEGNSRNFTFTVSIPTGIDSGVLGIQLNGFKWDTASAEDMDNLYTIDIEDFRSDVVTGLTIH